MENSAKQVHNVIDAFEIAAPLPGGPLLLVDDVVDSRWTMAVIAWLLLNAGSGPVYPFALAAASLKK